MKKVLFIFAAASLFLVGTVSTISVYANWTVPVISQYNKNKFNGNITNYHVVRSKSIPDDNYSTREYDQAAGGGWNYTTYNSYQYYTSKTTGIIYEP